MELTELTIAELGRAYRAGKTTPNEVTEAYLQRIERLNPLVNAYITVTAERARADANRASNNFARSVDQGPLQGVPVALKDIFDTAGIKTTMGASFLRENVPMADSYVAARLREAGAVLLGKTNTHEFAMGVSNNNPHYGPVRNPWDLARISGGSSGGSAAAVVAGLAAGAYGTDTGGSIRIPAALCGCVGFKPSFGAISRTGVFPFSSRLDHVGPIARTLEDAGLLFDAVAGYDPADVATLPLPKTPLAVASEIRGLRVGVPAQHFGAFEPCLAESVQQALEVFSTLGATVVPVTLPEFPMEAGMAAVAAEARAVHAPFLAEHAGEYGPDVQFFLGMAHPESSFTENLWREMETYVAGVRSVFAAVDLIAMPTTLLSALPIGQEVVPAGGHELPALVAYVLNTVPFNAARLPAVSVPCGVTPAGMPIGLQLIGRPLADAGVLSAATAYESATHWHERRVTDLAVTV